MALYSRPNEWGKVTSSNIDSDEPLPAPYVVVAHSPTPSTVSTAASSNPEK